MTMPSTTPAPSPITSAQNEGAAVTRHAVSFGAGAFTLLGLIAVLPADQVATAVKAIQDIGTHVQAIIGDVVVLVPIVTAAVSTLMAWKARAAASLPGQLKSITRNPEVELPAGSTIVVPSTVADQVPSTQVVAPQ